MVLPLIIAGAGLLANEIGEQQGASAYGHQLRKESDAFAGLQGRRRASIQQALDRVSPQAQLARVNADHARAYAPQQDVAQAVARAYGISDPEVASAIATAQPTMSDMAWQRAFGLDQSADQSALADETSREHAVDEDQWWWQHYLPSRLQRAGDKGGDMRLFGQLATAYGLGQAKSDFRQPLAGSSAGNVGSDATNIETGNRMTSDLGDRGWLGMQSAPEQAQPVASPSDYAGFYRKWGGR